MPLMSPDVAPVHCIIVRLANGWRIRDCSGHLGTRLNGKTITEEPLADDDHLQIGPFNFKVHLPARPEPVEPTSPSGPAASAAEGDPGAVDVDRLTQSRANLVRLARAYRLQAQAALQQQVDLKAELTACVRDLSADRSDLDRDWQQLEKSALALRVRELDLERAEKVVRDRLVHLEEEQRQLKETSPIENDDQHREALEALEKERADLANRLEHLELQCDQLDRERAEIEAARNELEAARLEVDGLRSQAEADQNRARDLFRQREQQLAQRAAELEARAANNQREPGDASPIQVVRVADDTLRQARDEARQQLDQLRLIADGLQRENEELRSKLSGAGAGAERPLVGSVGTPTVPRSELESSEAAYAALQMQLKRLQVERNQERSQIREQMEQLRQENELLRDRLAGTGSAPDAAEVNAAALQAHLRQAQSEREEENARSQAQIAELHQEIEILRQAAIGEATVPVSISERAEFEQQINSLTRETDRLRGLLKQVYEENEILKQQSLAALTVPSESSVEHLDTPQVSEDEMRQLVAHLDLLREENEQLQQGLLHAQSHEIELNNKSRTVELLQQQIVSLQTDLQQVQTQMATRDQEVEGLREEVALSGEVKTIQALRQSVHKLESDLQDRDAVIEKLMVALDAPTANMQHSGSYERELHQFRVELERDRRMVDEQLAELRQRQGDIEDAARETELQLSRERAAMARERNELTRMRDDIRMDQERLERLSKNLANNGASIAQLRSVLAQNTNDAVSPSNKDRRR